MLGSWRSGSRRPSGSSQHEREEPWLAVGLKPKNFVPGLLIGFLLGFLLDLPRGSRVGSNRKSLCTRGRQHRAADAGSGSEDLKMVLIVRQDLKMGVGKIASQCSHAATGSYADLVQSDRSLLQQWEQCGQPKIVLSCKNQQEMSKLKEVADRLGLPTFVVADAGKTQVTAGSRTVLAIGPGRKSLIDSVTGKLRLL